MGTLQILMRIVHIAAAVTLGGALVYQWLAVQPVLRTLDDGQRRLLATALAARWRSVVWVGIALLLVSGLVNFIVFKVPEYRGRPQASVYHALFGFKLLAALALFHAATMLVMPGERFERYRARARQWLRYAVGLLALIIIVAAVMRYLPLIWV